MNISELAEKITTELFGTTRSLENVLEDNDAIEFENNSELLSEIDQRIFNCCTCGWWCEICEESSEEYGLHDFTCLDCCGDL